jgi:hypothetical protein
MDVAFVSTCVSVPFSDRMPAPPAGPSWWHPYHLQKREGCRRSSPLPDMEEIFAWLRREESSLR